MRTLVVAAHPDDEVLGAGATIASLADAGGEVTVLIVAEGVSLRHEGVTLRAAQDNCLRAGEKLGVRHVRFGGFSQDGVLIADGPQRDVVSLIERTLRDVRPELVLTHHPGDIHADHRLVSQSISYATRLLGAGPVRNVLHFEVLSSTEQQTGLVAPFLPNVFADVSGFVDAKCEALEVYHYEVFDGAHPRSVSAVRALAQYRGVQAGVAQAEAFALSRQLLSAKEAR
ncbi:PIG-L deacetylase family protein [Streptomyces sp. NBC_00893]|uniref:PIG-L deacetylase family protein n=1 Tax=Streptomyces sp. NBC_00893 TaxID=2975862 RepID=UPI002258CB9E|nr:PIG-L deacetylase family protein [Streptomyces sp. NBC_00893]MCX4850453.1 PIG-L family deacetylase [Streptomyces sp. NBC_00893]